MRLCRSQGQTRCHDEGGASRWQLQSYSSASEEAEAERRAAPRSQRITFKGLALLSHHFGTSDESAVYRLRDLRIIRPAERPALLEEEPVRAAKEFLALFSSDVPPPRPKSSKTTPPPPDREPSRDVANRAIEAFRREDVPGGYLRDLGETLDIAGAQLVERAEAAADD